MLTLPICIFVWKLFFSYLSSTIVYIDIHILIFSSKEINGRNVPEDAQSCKNKISLEERQQTVNLAKNGVRSRRGRRMQASN